MLGMGFEPMNFVVSNLEFDALDRSANLTYEKIIASFSPWARLIVIVFFKNVKLC